MIAVSEGGAQVVVEVVVGGFSTGHRHQAMASLT
jgi:hypothetical protein